LVDEGPSPRAFGAPVAALGAGQLDGQRQPCLAQGGADEQTMDGSSKLTLRARRLDGRRRRRRGARARETLADAEVIALATNEGPIVAEFGLFASCSISSSWGELPGGRARGCTATGTHGGQELRGAGRHGTLKGGRARIRSLAT
jgi:hypothetical protein